MNKKMIAVAAACGLIVVGCAVLTRPSAPVDARWVACNTAGAGARCDVRIVRDDSGPYSCALGRFRVDPDFLELRGGRPVNIQWELNDPFVFCDRDGVDLKPGFGSGRVDLFENFGADRKDGTRLAFEASETCKPFRNWRWGNSTPGATYAYEIRFTDRRTQQKCKIDPFIKNG